MVFYRFKYGLRSILNNGILGWQIVRKIIFKIRQNSLNIHY
ncbi:hypothetical protein D1AOALGA4SA_9021 [Olavius algarvensis Delta 1 endosymbiont]|nr:hypothetical protein D1AOALGA4SA_9021 [Olavius algarvensis Delta 1 endosymbiont]